MLRNARTVSGADGGLAGAARLVAVRIIRLAAQIEAARAVAMVENMPLEPRAGRQGLCDITYLNPEAQADARRSLEPYLK